MPFFQIKSLIVMYLTLIILIRVYALKAMYVLDLEYLLDVA